MVSQVDMLKLYERIGKGQTLAHQYNKLPDDERKNLTFEEFKWLHQGQMKSLYKERKEKNGFNE